MTDRRLVALLHWTLLGVLVAGMLWAGAWRLQGGRWERVETPSMGTAAPVNSLLWVEPADFSSLGVGDFITFHPPGRPDLTYSHRVAVVHEDGTLGTKGEISAADPWRLSRQDVVGKVVMTWKGVGWLVVAAPVLIVGGLAVWLLAWRTRGGRWRLPVVVVGTALVLSVAITVYRPLVGVDQLGFRAIEAGARGTYVSTGLLPVRVQAHRGAHVDLTDGEVGTVVVDRPDRDGRYRIDLDPHVPMWWWVLLVGSCFLPAVWTLVVGLPDRPEPKRRAAPA